MVIEITTGKREMLLFTIIEKMAMLELRLKEIEILSADMRRIKNQIELFTISFEQFAERMEPIFEKREKI